MAYYKNNYVNRNGSWTSLAANGLLTPSGTPIAPTVELKGPQQVWAYPTASHNNPYWLTDMNVGQTVEERVYGYATASYEIIPGLKIQGRINMDRAKYSYFGRRYATSQNVSQMEDYGVYYQDKIYSNDIYVDALLSYNNKTFNDFDVSATAGWSGHTVSGETQKIYGKATQFTSAMTELPHGSQLLRAYNHMAWQPHYILKAV